MANPEETHPSPAQDSAKPAEGGVPSAPAVRENPSGRPPAVAAEAAPVSSPETKPAETSSAPAASEATPAATPVSSAPAGTVPMTDPNPAATTPSVEEPRSEYHPTDVHHDEPYHDHHHGPGEDPYHHDYQYDENYHHGPGEGDAHSGGATVMPDAGGGGDTLEPLFDEKPGEGGPVKPFLEHLEDLRWVIIKVTVVTLVGMTICLFAANAVVALLKWPMDRSAHLYPDPRQHISVMIGPKEVLNFKLATNNLPAWPIATNRFVELELVPIMVGTNQILTVRVRSTGEEVPAEKAKPLIYENPAEPFLNSLHIAFFGGLLLAAPFVTYFLVSFLLPALKAKERKYFLKAMLPAAALFVAGVCMCYFLILPLALRAAEQYSQWMGVDMLFWKATDYFGFCIKFMLGMGAGFEMPVVLLALVKIGLLDYAKLAGFRRYMILINLILGALLTTPEVLTQVAMFVPLQVLYEITIWIAWYWEQPDRRLARRRLAMAIVGFLLLIGLCYCAYRFGWPWLKAWRAQTSAAP